ncbi:MAG: DUF6754 domain-containing protein [Bacillota bacterium]
MSEFLLAAAAAEPVPARLGLFRPIDNSVFSVVVSITMCILVYVMITRARRGQKIPEIRKIPGIDAFEEAIGRATEMGKPVHLTDYSTNLGEDSTFAYWSFMAYIAKQCARYDTRFIVSDANYLVNVVNQEIVKQAYLEAGKPDSYNPDDVRFVAGSQFAWAMGVAGFVGREKPAAQFLVGYFYAESLILAEAGNLVGAIQVAAASSPAQIPFFVAACDYTMIGEELYAGAAYVSKDPVIMGTVVAQDIVRIALYILVLVGGIIDIVSPEANFVKDMIRF